MHMHTQRNVVKPLNENGNLAFVVTWKDFESIMLSEISQRNTNTVWSYYTWSLRKTHGYREQIYSY